MPEGYEVTLFSILGQGTLFLMSASLILTIVYLLVSEWDDEKEEE